MKIAITGANGFIGLNLRMHLQQRPDTELLLITKQSTEAEIRAALETADFIFHLAGSNRPPSPDEFISGNVEFTRMLCDRLSECNRKPPILFASSIQAGMDNPYGKSKLEAESLLTKYRDKNQAHVFIYRLPNVFGKWARPNYNSVVATFCHNISRDIPININDPNSLLPLAYIDDVIKTFLDAIDGPYEDKLSYKVGPQYQITVGELADQIRIFRESRETLMVGPVGSGLTRALYATYLSYQPIDSFIYEIPSHRDHRGIFVEMVKTVNHGQFSYFTALPGVTRGGHYHHTKNEKFLLVKGVAKFGFRHVVTDERFSLEVSSEKPQIVESIPGWSHDITNIGEDEMIVLAWANELFDRDVPETYSFPV